MLSRPRNVYRDSANAAIAPSPTASAVAITAITALLRRKRQKSGDVRTKR